MAARTFRQQSFTTESNIPDSFRRAPFSMATQLFLEAFPEIDDMKSFVSKKVAALTSAEPEETGAELQEAARLSAAAWEVKQFCENYSQISIEPSLDELEKMWSRCENCEASELTAGINDLLASWGSSGDLDWQPRLRALLLLEYLCGQPRAAEAAEAAAGKLEPMLLFVSSEVPQCKNVAYRLLMMRAAGAQVLSAESSAMETETEHVLDIDAVCRRPSFAYVASKLSGDCPLETGSLPSTDCDTAEDEFNPDLPLPEEPRAAPVSGESEPRATLSALESQSCSQPEQLAHQRPYLWLSSVETVAMEKAPDPFDGLKARLVLPL